MAHVHGAAAKAAANHAHHAMKTAGSAPAMAESLPAVHRVSNGLAAAGTTAVVAATPHGKGFMGFLSRHPLLVFGLGLAVGYLAHKYRKEIILGANSLTGGVHGAPSNPNLDELAAECGECSAEPNPTEGQKAP